VALEEYRAPICRLGFVILGIAYTGITAVSLPGSEPFYKTLGVIKIMLTLTITLVAFRWPHEIAYD